MTFLYSHGKTSQVHTIERKIRLHVTDIIVYDFLIIYQFNFKIHKLLCTLISSFAQCNVICNLNNYKLNSDKEIARLLYFYSQKCYAQ